VVILRLIPTPSPEVYRWHSVPCRSGEMPEATHDSPRNAVSRSCHTLELPCRRMGRSPRKYTDQQLAEAVNRSRSMREVLIALRLAPRGGNYETVWRRIERLGLDASHLRTLFDRGRSPRSCSDQEIIEAVIGARSLAQVLVTLGIRRGGNQARLKSRIADLGLDTSHFVGQGWKRGDTTPAVPAAPLGGGTDQRETDENEQPQEEAHPRRTQGSKMRNVWPGYLERRPNPPRAGSHQRGAR
jgi:hypothetical protein